MKRFIVFIIIVIFIPVGFLAYLFSPVGFSDKTIRFVVPLDTKQEKIPARLQKEGLIRSPALFTFLASFRKIPPEIEPGAYRLAKNMHLLTMIDTLLFHPYQKWITLVPGLRMEQTAEKLAEKFKWDENRKQEFLSHAKEGYLFPDTYLLYTDITGKEAAERLLSNFNEKFDATMQQSLLSRDVRNDTAIKIASLIQRESGGDEDKAIIAGIIWNRLEKDMRLQLDAANQYVIGKSGNWWPMVKPSDLKIDSPYNLYTNKGLPPGPICSPSLSAIKAAVYPAVTDCLFYLHSRDKQIHCAVTYEEHLENIQKYLKN